jgi:hypothetical protein
LDELQFKAHQSIEVVQTQQKKFFGKKMKKQKFKKNDIVMMFDV